MQPIQFENYEKLSDDVHWLSSNCVLRMNVKLNKGGKFFRTEYKYNKDNSIGITVRRSYDYFLTLEMFNKQDKDNIMINVKDFPRFKNLINTSLSWFVDKKYNKLYCTIKGSLALVSPIPCCQINGLPAGKYIRTDPTIIEYGGDKQPGICLSISECLSINLTVDQLLALDCLINTFNMFQSAQMMLSSFQVDLGTNTFDMTDKEQSYTKQYHEEQKEIGITGIQGRRIGQNRGLL